MTVLPSEPYLEPHQSKLDEPTDFHHALGDTIEAAYADGVHDLDGLVARLNDSGPAFDGGVWTAENFTALMAELGR